MSLAPVFLQPNDPARDQIIIISPAQRRGRVHSGSTAAGYIDVSLGTRNAVAVGQKLDSKTVHLIGNMSPSLVAWTSRPNPGG